MQLKQLKLDEWRHKWQENHEDDDLNKSMNF